MNKVFREKIFNLLKNEGRIINGKYLDVSSFVNHQLNTELLVYLGESLRYKFKELKPDVIITPESSGNAIATAIAVQQKYPPNVIVERKKESITWNGKETVVTGNSVSQTKGGSVCFHAVKEYLSKYETYFFVDDFLRQGNTFQKIFDACELELKLVGVFNLIAILEGEEKVKEISGLDENVLSGITISETGSDYLVVQKIFGEEVNKKVFLKE